jgi:aldose 1-epimerase
MEVNHCFKHTSGKDIYLYTLKNDKGTKVMITNYGAIIVAYKIKMQDDNTNDIVLGFDDVADYLNPDYLKQYPFFGAAIGRYANRIENASFEIDGKKFSVSKNFGECQLHGGFEGFDKKVWDFASFDERHNILNLKYFSRDGEEGFPGNFEVNIFFELNDENDLALTYTALCDQPTAANLTHHSYFNLNNGEGTIADHEIKIYSDKILQQDKNLVAMGNYISVENTKFDFREFHAIKERWNEAEDYDQSFELSNRKNNVNHAAEVYSKKSGLKMQVLTSEPLIHFYTGQGIPKIKGKAGIEYGPYSGLCLETQKHPNAINIPNFPNTILRPGETYHHKTIYKVLLPEK